MQHFGSSIIDTSLSLSLSAFCIITEDKPAVKEHRINRLRALQPGLAIIRNMAAAADVSARLTAKQKGTVERQKKLGPAPFASFEDLSPEGLSSPEDQGYEPLPNLPDIVEEDKEGRGGENNDGTSASTSTAQTPTTPRIDVEQASSPSQEDSGDSTPEREIFGLSDMNNVSAAFLEGAADVDLRSSAEELYIPYADRTRRSSNSPSLQPDTAATMGHPAHHKPMRKISWDASDCRTTVQVSVHSLERKGSGGSFIRHGAGDPFIFPSRGTRLSSVSSSLSGVSGLSALSSFSRRSPSPHRMLLETSFVGAKGNADDHSAVDDQDDEELVALGRRMLNPTLYPSRSASPAASPMSPGFNRSLMVRYTTEPRSRPTSPNAAASPAVSPMPTDASNRLLPTSPRFYARRSSSPARTLVETSFCGHMQIQVPQEELVARGPSPVPSLSSLSVSNATAVRYTTEPRSRPVSPLPMASASVANLSTPTIGGVDRRGSFNLRSPSPCRMIVETSFCGAKRIANENNQDESAVGSPDRKRPEDRQQESAASSPYRRPSEQLLTPRSPMKPVQYHREPRSRSPSPCPFTETAASPVPSTGDNEPDFTTIRQRPVHLKTFDSPAKTITDVRETSTTSSEGTLSPQQQNGTSPSAVPASPSRNPFQQSPAVGRSLPKPVACPKPPTSFMPIQQTATSQSSPVTSPTVAARRTSSSSQLSQTPSTAAPSSPFNLRKSSITNVFRRNSNASSDENNRASQQVSRKGSSDTLKSDAAGSQSPEPDTEHPLGDQSTPVKKEAKSRNVFTALFGKKGSKKEKDKEKKQKTSKSSDLNGQTGNLELHLPVAKSRESSPGRSSQKGESGHSADDLDDDEAVGFQHQVLETTADTDDRRRMEASALTAELSDSEKESDAEVKGAAKVADKEPVIKEEPEKFSLFSQESMDEELPYVPTTLPIERPVAPLITPVRMRMAEMKMTPTQRPRCSVSIGPCSITDYVKIVQPPVVQTDQAADAEAAPVKIKVSLPRRQESTEDNVTNPPVSVSVTRVSLGSIKWETFAEQALRSPRNLRRTESQQQGQDKPMPSLPIQHKSEVEAPAAIKAPVKLAWVNVDEIPEPIKAVKKIHLVDGRKMSLSTVDEAIGRDGQRHRVNPTADVADDQVDESGALRKLSDGELRQRKDSVSSETALLREIDDAEVEPQIEDDNSISINGRQSHSR